MNNTKTKTQIKAIALMSLLEVYYGSDEPLVTITKMFLRKTSIGYTKDEFKESLIEIRDIFNEANVIINNMDDKLTNDIRLDYIDNYGDVVVRDCF